MGTIWLTDLPDVIARAGLKVATWPGWATRANKRGGYEAVWGIAVHHTAGNSDAPNDCAYMWDNAPLKPIGAIHLARDGSVTVGAAGQTNCQGLGGPLATTRGVIPQDRGNSYAIAIEAANNGVGEPWPQAQQDAYVRLCAALCNAYGLTAADVFAHHEWTTRKIDPAGPARWGPGEWDMDMFRADVADAMTGPQPPQPEEDDMRTLPTPQRVYDSRKSTPLKAREVRSVPVLANTVGVNITVTSPADNGWLTVWGVGTNPGTSNVNFRSGQTQANYAQVVTDGGVIRIEATTACHVVIDLQAAG